MLTRRQKRALRGFTAGLSCCILLSGVLAFMAVSGTKPTEPVVFSDILDGAVATAPENAELPPEVTLDESRLYETMFSEELLTYTSETNWQTYEDIHGAGGTILINTTPVTEETQPPETEATTVKTTKTTTAEAAAPTEKTTSKTTARTTSKPPETTAASTAPKTTATRKTTTTKAATTKATTAAKTTTAPKTTKSDSTTSKPPFLNVGGGTFSRNDEFYIRLFNLVNKARREAGVKELWYSARLHEVCVVRVTELTSYYSHQRPNGERFCTAFTDLGIAYRTCGENIAYGRNMFDTPEEVFEAWMNSESHRENLLRPEYECVAFGLSVIKVDSDTYYYWTQEFAQF